MSDVNIQQPEQLGQKYAVNNARNTAPSHDNSFRQFWLIMDLLCARLFTSWTILPIYLLFYPQNVYFVQFGRLGWPFLKQEGSKEY